MRLRRFSAGASLCLVLCLMHTVNGDVWIVGTNPVPGGYELYRWNEPIYDWDLISIIGGVAISVDGWGDLFVVQDDGTLYKGTVTAPLPGTPLTSHPPVPDVIGMATADGVWALQNAGYVSTQTGTTITSDPNLDGTIESTTPAGGSPLGPGYTVHRVDLQTDKIPPVITLNGPAEVVIHYLQDPYVEQNAAAYDGPTPCGNSDSYRHRHRSNRSRRRLPVTLRRPSTAFGTDYEAAKTHWNDYGKNEGRDFSSLGVCGETGGLAELANAEFDPCWYLNFHADLKAAFGSGNIQAAYEHWINNGLNEGRQTNENFDVRAYLNRHSDLVTAFGPTNYRDAYNHWNVNGKAEGRDPSPFVPVITLSGPTEVRAVHSGKCLDVVSALMENGANVQQWDSHGGTNQK